MKDVKELLVYREFSKVKARMKEIAEQRGVNFSEVMREAVQKYLNKK